MLELLKLLKWDLQVKSGRFHYWFFILRNLPGKFGMRLRSRFVRRYLHSVGSDLTVHEGVRIRNVERLTCGNHVVIGVNNFLQAAGGIELGDHVLLGPDVKVWSSNHVFKDPNRPVREQGYEERKVVIGSNVWVGANCFIMPGAEIGEGCIVSAGSVVGKKVIPPYSILAGNPARKIGSRTNGATE